MGAGRWAVALARGFAGQGIDVVLWEPDPSALRNLLASRRHPDLPDSATIPAEVQVTGDLRAAISDSWLVVFATPSHALAQSAREAAPHISDVCVAVVTVTKGIDPESTERMSVVLGRTVPGRPVVVLAGPGIPYDYALGDPTSLVAASEDSTAAELIRDSFSSGNLRIYSSGDVIGVELGAALKNVVAIAAGIADGLELGLNARAALLTRGLAEMTRLGLAMNANPLTFAGLSGMGDLIVTAFSANSRNHNLGLYVAQGLDLKAASARLNGVAEGALTCRSARVLASRHRVEMPITEEVHGILYEGADPKQSLRRLLGRSPKPENSGVTK
ncbi:MAG: NAD(P)-dependent glycerol-3-phosphate dehydrogenase [candidate division WOR-3 bacterium]|nr:MAG: NAD(P)-dependent glycerol-3-phosphate dehydrogenase [candidate division WOR-3 bacterium]